jgi:hypothetical protein
VVCRGVKLPGGGSAIVCGPRGRTQKCAYCAKSSVALCDAVVGKTLGGADITCDRPLCKDHARHVEPDEDFCPNH